MISELRKLIVLWLLELAFNLEPKGNFKNEFAIFLKENILKQ